MNKVIRLGQILLVTSLVASSLAFAAPPLNRESAKAYCTNKRYCARTSDSRIMFVDPRPSDVDRTLGFNLVDGQPIQ
jgi:hypothetical protein